MEIASLLQEEHDRVVPRTLSRGTLSDTSATSNTSSKAQNFPSPEAFYQSRDKRVKLMCSCGGKILPRPSDRKLRYVGGLTRMVSVSRQVPFVSFVQKLMEIYGSDLAVKYQLPEEDLDALVSVTSDEDLENMMDECDRLNTLEGTSRLRVFVFPSVDNTVIDLKDIVDPKTSEIHYVDAVNAVQPELTLKKNGPFGLTDGHLGYASQGQPGQLNGLFAHPENSQPRENTFDVRASLSNDVSHLVPPPLPVVSSSQEKAPLEYVSIKSPDRNFYHGDFRDLECGASAHSSASSQQDLYNRYSTHQWAHKTQKQLNTEPRQYGSQLQDSSPHGSAEDQPRKAEQPPVRDAQKKEGVHDLGMSMPWLEQLPYAFGQFCDVEAADSARMPDTDLHRDGPLSPGAILQKQLEADQEYGELSGAESLQPYLNRDLMQPSQLLHEQQQLGRLPFPFNEGATPLLDTTLNADLPISQILHTQLFEPADEHQSPNGQANLVLADNSALSATTTKPIDEGGEPEKSLQEAKLHELSIDLSAVSPPRDYPNSMFDEDDRERNNLSMFASQSFSQEPYNPVFQTCCSEISPPSMEDVDDFLQHVLLPSTNFTDQRSMHEYSYGLNSQAPWLPSVSSHLPSQGNGSMLESHSLQRNLHDIPGDTIRQPTGRLRTQNYDGRLYLPGRMMFNEPAQDAINKPISETKLLEEFSTQDRVSKGGLPSSQSTTNSVRSELVSSLGSRGELNVEHDAPEPEILSGLSELSVCGNPVDKNVGPHLGFKSSKESALQEEAYSHAIEGRDQEANKEEAGDKEALGFPIPSFSATPSVLEAWMTTLQGEHEPQSVEMLSSKQKKDLEERELSGPAQKEMTIELQERKSEIDDLDLEAFQSAADMPMRPAAAAEAEAIARGLQTIRHSDLEELRELGSGTFGTVYHGKWRGTDVAIKRIKSSCFMGKPSERERLIADFWQEAFILGQLHHPNVVAFYGVVPDGPGGTLATLTEFMVNGSLKQALQKKDRLLDRRKRLLIAMDAAFGMEYLHGKNVVHFDLKCENLLVNLRDIQRPICKVGDLGLSKVKQQTMVSGGVRGTLPWMAPELLNGSSSLVSEKVDVFSFGIVLWELLTGEEPYATMHYGAIIGGIVSNTLRPPVPNWCDPAWKSLMETCWSADPSVRPTFSEIARRLRAMEAILSVKGQGQGLAPIV